MAVGALIQEFTAIHPVIIDVIFSVKREGIVIAIFIEMAANVHVAIFVVCLHVYVIAIDTVCSAQKSDDRRGVNELVQLLKETSRKIKITSGCGRFKGVTIKTIAAKDG